MPSWAPTDHHCGIKYSVYIVRNTEITYIVLMLYSHHHDQLYKHIWIWNHNDTIIMTTRQWRWATQSFRRIYSHFIWKGSKRVTQGFTVRGSWRPNRTAIYWPPLLWPSALCLSRSLGLLNRRPRGPAFCWVLAFSTTSCLQLLVSKTNWLPVFTELYNSSIAHSIFGMACLIVIKQK